MRSLGGVSITLMSRSPTSDMCNVRGIGRGGHGKDVHFFAHLLQALFVAHAEALFFIDDQQSKIGELYVLGQQAVSADEDVDLSGFDSLQNIFLLFG